MLYKSRFCKPLHGQELQSFQLADKYLILVWIIKLNIKDNS